MPYIPSFEDIPISSAVPINNNGAYIPSINDIPTNNVNSLAQQPVPQNNALTNFGLGAAGAIRNFAQDIADLPPTIAPHIFPRGEFPQVPQAQGISGIAGNIVGNIAPFLGGGELLDAARGLTAASDLPIAATAAKWLGGEIPGISARLGGSTVLPAIARQTIGGGIYGGITNPEDPGIGAIKGAAISAPLAGLPFGLPYAKTLADYFNPQKVSDNILDTISQGNNVAENAKSLTTDINRAFNNAASPLKQGFSEIKSQVGDKPIYGENPNALGNSVPGTGDRISGPLANSSYLNIFPKIEKYTTPDINDLHDAFMQNPTYDNARSLFSQYASEVARLQGKAPGDLEANEVSQLQSLRKGKNAIDSDIQNFLINENPSLADQYNQLKQNWVKNVIPYYASDVSRVLGNNPDIPVNIHTLFGTQKHLPDVNDMKVFNDLPQDAQNKIIYSALGKDSSTKTPNALNNTFSKLNEQGLADLVNPSLKDQFSQLQSALDRRAGLNTLLGSGIGLGIGHHLGVSPELMFGLGAFLGNKVLPKIYNLPLVQPLANSFGKATRSSYPALSTTLRANLIPGGQ